MTKDKALKLALDFLLSRRMGAEELIVEIQEALAHPAPVQVWRDALERIADPQNTHFAGDAQIVAREALYTTPPAAQPAPSQYGSPELQAIIVARAIEKDRAAQRTWVGLTDVNAVELWQLARHDIVEFTRAIEAKLKELNT